jgi:hypothetical protein
VSFCSKFVASVLVAKNILWNGVETNIAVTLSTTVDRTCKFSIGPIHAFMIASLKSKRNESGEVSFGSNLVASGLVAKKLVKWWCWNLHSCNFIKNDQSNMPL